MPGSSQSDRELLEINAQMESLLHHVRKQFMALKQSIETADFGLMQGIILEDNAIDRIELNIDELSLNYVQKRAPLGTSLRLMFGCVDVAASLERIGDCIEYIARYVSENKELKMDFPEGWNLIIEMASRCEQIFEKAAKSFSSQDAAVARLVPQMDSMIDALQDRAYKLVIDQVRGNKVDVELGVYLILIVNKLESIGDIACHIAKTVVQIVDDENLRHLPQ